MSHAGGFLGKWFGRAAPMAPDVAEAVAQLDRQARERPSLAESARLVRDLIVQLYAQVPEVPALNLDHQRMQSKLDGAVPLLRGEQLSLPAGIVRQRWLDLCAVLQRHSHDEPTQPLAEAVRQNRLQPEALLQGVLAGRPEALPAEAERLGLDAGLLATTLRLLFFPWLAQLRSGFMPALAGRAWERGDCPCCGGQPLLAEARGLEQGRFLRCGWCAAAWEAPRWFCPFCAERDHHALGYFEVEGEETRFRVMTCEACRHYLKTVATLAELAGPQLLAADALTLHLDLAAAERGYVV